MLKLYSFLFIFAVAKVEVHAQHYGLIYSEITSQPNNFSQHCFIYNPNFKQLPQSIEEAPREPLVNLLPLTVCNASDVAGRDFAQAVVAVKRGNCTFSEKATLIQEHHGSAILVVSDDGNITPSPNSTDDYNRINITVAVIQDEAFKEITDLGDAVSVQLYEPANLVDYNLIVIWLIAVLTVAGGAYWSGTVKHRRALNRLKKSSRTSVDNDDEDEDEALDSLEPSPLHILVFVVLMCGMLVSLYYLFNYLVYLIIGMFTLATAMSMYACFKPLMLRCCGSKAGCRLRVRCCGERSVEVRRLMLAAVSVATAVTWLVMRHEWYAWILQDLLGIMFCMNMMKTLRLSSLQACAFLLILLFVYDVFFVFVTPLLTEDGESIMVKVATGGGGGGSAANEKLPMVFLVPRFRSIPCQMLPYSMLGFGDILVPGLLVSFCYAFDLEVESKKLYYIVTCIGYGIGMVCTFVGLTYMESGQPALLYLVPCTLLPVVLLALKRRELTRMWNGKLLKLKNESGTDENEGAENRQEVAGVTHRNNSNTNLENVLADTADTVSNASSTDSQQHLLINNR